MDLAHMQHMPGDPRLVDQLVYELKSKGIFDQFRKECIADVDTRPAYQNLRQRVESSVASFLARQTWKPDLNKNQLREKLRKHLLDGNYLEQGVGRIVDQVVNPKVASVFIPQVEDIVYNYLGIPRKKPATETITSTDETQDLLPTDLEAVSPGSVRSEEKDGKPDQVQMDIDESKDDSVMFVEDVKNDDTQLSGISELTINDTESMDKSIIPLPAEEIKLENIPAPENSPPDIEKENIDLGKINLPKEPNPSTDIPLPDELPKTEKDNYFKPMILHSEDDSRSDSDSSLRRNMSPLTPIRNFLENSCDAQQGFDNDSDDKSQDKVEPKTFRFTIEKSENGEEATEIKTDTKTPLPYHFSNQADNTFNTPNYNESSNSNNLQIDYESDLNSKSVDVKPETENSEDSPNKKKDEKRSSHKSSHRSREHKSSSKDRSHKSRDSSRHDKDKKSSRNDRSRDKTHNDKSADKKDVKDNKDKDKHRSSSSHKSSHKDSHRSSSSSKNYHKSDKKSSSTKEKSEKRDEKTSSSKSSSHKSDRDRDRKSEKENRDKKKKKETDDHYSHSGRGNPNRRSTDRDSNDGSSSSKGTYNPSGKTSDNRKGSKSTSKSDNTSTSSNSDSPSDRERMINQANMSKTPQKPVVKVDSLNVPAPSPSRLPFVPDVTLKKPRFASNMAEAKKMIKMRKFLEDEQKRMNQEAALLLEFQANVRPSLSQVYSSIPGPELEFACGSSVQTSTQVIQENVQNEAVIETYVEDPDTSYELEISNEIIAETLLAMHREHGNRIPEEVELEIATDDNITVEGVNSATTIATDENIVASGMQISTEVVTDENIIVDSVQNAFEDNIIDTRVKTATEIVTQDNIIVSVVNSATTITTEGDIKSNNITEESQILQGKEEDTTTSVADTLIGINIDKSESKDATKSQDFIENTDISELKLKVPQNDDIDIENQNITVIEDLESLKTPENQIIITGIENYSEIQDDYDNLVIDESENQDLSTDDDCSIQDVTVIQNDKDIQNELSEIRDEQSILEIQHNEQDISGIDEQNDVQNSNDQDMTVIQDVLENKDTSETQESCKFQETPESKENIEITNETTDSESELITLEDINVNEFENVFSESTMSILEKQLINKESDNILVETFKNEHEESVLNIVTENVAQVAQCGKSSFTVVKDDFPLPPNVIPLQYFAEHEKFNSELERYKFDMFFKSSVDKDVKNKIFLINCDIDKQNLIIDAAKPFGDYEIVNFCKNGHVEAKKAKKVVKHVNVTREIMFPTKICTNNTSTKTSTTPKSTSSKMPTIPSTPKIISPIFSPRSECSFELSSDYDIKLEEMVNKTSRQQVMEIILGGAIEGDIEIPENPQTYVYPDLKPNKIGVKEDVATNVPGNVVETMNLGQNTIDISIPENVSGSTKIHQTTNLEKQTSEIDSSIAEKKSLPEKVSSVIEKDSSLPEKASSLAEKPSPPPEKASSVAEKDTAGKIKKIANPESFDFDIEKGLQVNVIDKDSCKCEGDRSNLKRKIEDLETETSSNNKLIRTPHKLRKASESEQISSTTEDTDAVVNKGATKSKYLGKSRRVGLSKPKKPAALPNSPSSDKSVENYEQYQTPQKTPNPPNGKIKPTPRSKVQRYDTSDLYKPKLHYLSRRNNVN